MVRVVNPLTFHLSEHTCFRLSTPLNGTDVVQSNSSSSRSSAAIAGGDSVSWLYTFSRMILIVSLTGTFVKRLSTSKELGAFLLAFFL